MVTENYQTITQDIMNLEIDTKSIEQKITELKRQLSQNRQNLKSKKSEKSRLEIESSKIKTEISKGERKVENIKTKNTKKTETKTTILKTISKFEGENEELNVSIANLNDEITSLNSQINANRIEIERFDKFTHEEENETQNYKNSHKYRDEISKLQREIADLKLSEQQTANQMDESTKNSSVLRNAKKVNTSCVNNYTRLVKEAQHQFDTDKAKVMSIYDEIRSIFSQQTASLFKTINDMNETIEVREYLVSAKRSLHEYLDSLPSDPKILSSIEAGLDRRRRLRKKRRMI